MGVSISERDVGEDERGKNIDYKRQKVDF